MILLYFAYNNGETSNLGSSEIIIVKGENGMESRIHNTYFNIELKTYINNSVKNWIVG